MNILGKTYFIPLLFISLACTPSKQTELAWEKNLYQIGSQSSPKVADLNQDGVGDIVMGAGLEEISFSDHGVIALDGKTGELLWKHPANAQMVGSASFLDITSDSIPDVFIGGRNANLKAINGSSGELIWEYTFDFEKDSILQYAKYNFYNSQWVPDQNEDGIPDLLTVNGGNWLIAPDSSAGREPGVLMLFDPTNGNILAADTMPDGQESYMSPLCFMQTDQDDPLIVFGTGGETQSGALYVCPLPYLVEGNLQAAKKIFEEVGHGFIAPPSLADVNGDAYIDILAVSHAGKVRAIEGKGYGTLWERDFPGYESSNQISLGFVNKDQTPDLLTWMSKGKWPLYSHSLGLVLDGATGELLYADSSACFTLASPVVYDLNGDGRDEAILSRNEYDCSLNVKAEDSLTIEISNDLVALDFEENRIQSIDLGKKFKNFFSSPWIGDIDQDEYLDIVYVHYFHGTLMQKFMGMRIRRISSSIRMKGAPMWGAYMGTRGDGRFIENEK